MGGGHTFAVKENTRSSQNGRQNNRAQASANPRKGGGKGADNAQTQERKRTAEQPAGRKSRTGAFFMDVRSVQVRSRRKSRGKKSSVSFASSSGTTRTSAPTPLHAASGSWRRVNMAEVLRRIVLHNYWPMKFQAKQWRKGRMVPKPA